MRETNRPAASNPLPQRERERESETAVGVHLLSVVDWPSPNTACLAHIQEQASEMVAFIWVCFIFQMCARFVVLYNSMYVPCTHRTTQEVLYLGPLWLNQEQRERCRTGRQNINGGRATTNHQLPPKSQAEQSLCQFHKARGDIPPGTPRKNKPGFPDHTPKKKGGGKDLAHSNADT